MKSKLRLFTTLTVGVILVICLLMFTSCGIIAGSGSGNNNGNNPGSNISGGNGGGGNEGGNEGGNAGNGNTSDTVTYTVKFDTGGGTSFPDITVYHGTSFYIFEDPAREGFIFLGWTLNGEEWAPRTPVTENMTLVAVWMQRDNNEDGVIYTVSDDLSCYYVSGFTDDAVNVRILREYNGLPVSRIARGAFSECTSLKSIVIEDNITEIGEGAFKDCTELESIELPSSISTVSYNMLNGCRSLKSITIPDSITNIDDYAFKYCTSLTEISIPENIKAIGNDAFDGCTSLSEVHITDLSLWCGIEFEYYLSNPLYFAHDLYLNGERITNLTIPNDVTAINSWTFAGCSSITDVTVHNGVEQISFGFLYGCNGVEKISIPFTEDSQIYTKYSALGHIFDDGYLESNENINDNVPRSLKRVTVTNTSSICSEAFDGCSGIEAVVLSGNITLIGDRAFANCTSLKSIVLPESLLSIGKEAFYRCGDLSDVELPSSLTSISTRAFYDCDSITSIVLPDSLTFADNEIFLSCDGMTEITLPFIGNTPNQADNVRFKNIFRLNSSLPPSMKKVTITKCDHIPADAFSDCGALESIILPDTLISIGEGSFYNCYGLTVITLPSSLESIGASAFEKCSGLRNITIPANVTSIGNNAFNSCRSLESFSFQDNCRLTSIPAYMLQFCERLESISIPHGITEIGGYAFSDCFGLKEITIADSVVRLGSAILRKCNAVEEITLPFIGDSSADPELTCFGQLFDASSYSSNGKKVPSTLKSVTVTNASVIHGYAFYGCENISIIRINADVSEIGDHAFYGCSSLEGVIIDDESKLTSIGSHSFYNCNRLFTFDVPPNVKSIGVEAFSGCFKLIEVINRSELQISAGASDHGGIGRYAKGILADSSNSLFIKDGDYTFYNIDGEYYLLNYSGTDRQPVLPDTVLGSSYAIYDYAFFKSSITDIVIPDGVTAIGFGAFADCDSLACITLPFLGRSLGEDTDTHFGYIFGAEDASQNKSCVPSSLKSLTITKSSVIDNYSLQNCVNLTELTILCNIESIGADAFIGCECLTAVYISDIQNWCSTVFANEKANPLYYARALYLNGEPLTELVIPEGTVSVNPYAFIGCEGLTSVTLPSSLSAIGESAFASCGLTSISFGSNITDIGASAFKNCTALTSVSFADGIGITRINDDCFSGCSALGAAIIPHGVAEIGSNSFSGCTSLTEIVIPDSVTRIGINMLYGCNSLIEITVPYVGDTPGSSRYTRFDYLFGATNPNDTTKYVPKSLKKITVTTAANIAYAAFDKCIYVEEMVLPFIGTSLNGMSNASLASMFGVSENMYIPSSLKKVTVTHATIIREKTFYECSGLTEIVLGDQVKTIEDNAFGYCKKLSRLVLPDGATNLGEGIFIQCTSLAEITLPSGITDISNAMFSGCSALTEVNLPDGIRRIGEYAFSGCSALTEITIPESVTFIGHYAFRYCESLKSIIIPKNVTKIGKNVFYFCNKLEGIVFEDANNWYSTNIDTHWNDNSYGTPTDLSDPSANMSKLCTGSDKNLYWYKL